MRAAIFAAAICAALSLTAGAHAQATDPADIEFWHSIANSTDVEEYKAYLEAFPNGRFAPLARLRIRPGALQPQAARAPKPPPAAPAPQPAAAPTPAPAPAPAAAAIATPAAAPEHPERIGVTPPAAKIGQQVTLTCDNFPQPTNYDILVVVPSGTPDFDAHKSDADNHILWKNYAANCSLYTQKAGPFAPGTYEARFLTRLYNNAGRLEAVAKTNFAVH